MTSTGLLLENIVKRFGQHAAVNGASLEVAAGEIVALLGPSGCGKTTTLRLIAGFEQLDSGRIVISGRNIVELPPYQRNIGVVFQDYALFPHLTVADNIDYGMRQRGVDKDARAKKRGELLRLARLDGLDARRPAALSGGQQQRVALARALAINPRLLLLDEPLSNLDAKLRESLRTELREILRAVGTTTLVVTHDQIEAIGLADRIALMNGGQIVQVGTPREIYERPATRFVAEFIGQSLWFGGRFSDGRFAAEDGQSFTVAPPARIAARQGLVVRPEHVHLKARADDANRIPAKVERVQFYGAELVVTCRLDGGDRLVTIPIRSDDPDVPQVGDAVTLGFAADRGIVVPDE